MRNDIRDAIGLLESHGIPAMRSKDPDCLVFEVGENVFRAPLPADPTRAASLLIDAVGNRGKILDDYREAVQGLGRVETLDADDVYWDDLFSNGDPVENRRRHIPKPRRGRASRRPGPAGRVGRRVASGRFRHRQGRHG